MGEMADERRSSVIRGLESMTSKRLGRSAAAVLMFTWAAGAAVAQGDHGTLKARYDALVKEVDGRFETAHKAYAAARNEAEKKAVDWPDHKDYAPRFLALAREDPADSAACDALCWIIVHHTDLHQRLNGLVIGLEAADLLIVHHLDDDRLGRACLQATYGASMPSPARDRLFAAVYQKSRNVANRGRACLAMAQYLKSKVDLHEQLRLPDGEELAEILEKWTGKEYVTSFRDGDPRALTDESVRLFRRVIAEFGGLEYIFEHRHPEHPRTLREIAEPELYELTCLAIGREAPEIAGEDLDGKPMKLSDYRGKVVVVSFWGAWCGACMAMVPHERDLAARLAGRPFAILGVNSDEGRATARQTMSQERMNWRSWADGKVGGPIAAAWNVRLWPTFFIIDARGIIRAHGVLGEDMIGKTVDGLLEEAEGTSTRPAVRIADGDSGKRELERYQGTWILVAEEFGGRDVPAGKRPEITCTVRGDEVVSTVRGKDVSAFVELDPTKEPKTYELIREDGVQSLHGIYAWEGDDAIKICAADHGGDRPTEFKTRHGSFNRIRIWKRKK